MYLIPQSFVCLLICVIVLYCKLSNDIIHYYEISCYLIEEGMVSDIIHVCNLSIDFFQICNVFCCFVFCFDSGAWRILRSFDNGRFKIRNQR
jgi:hypothetical protein